MQKIIDDIKTFSQTHKIKVLPLMISVATLLFVVLGAIGVLYVQSPLNQTQTIVNQASTGTGLVILTSQLVSPTVFTQGAPSTVDLKFNSQGAQLSGLQVRVKVTANSGTPTLTVSQTSGLKANYQQVEKVSDGYIVTMIVSAVNLGQSFTSTAATTFARLTIPLAAPGQIKLNYDRATSIATIANSTDTTDQLRTPVDVTYTVGTTQTATPTPMPTATPRVSPSASPVPTATPKVTPTAVPTVAPTAAPTASPISSTGVVTGVQLTTPKPGQIVATWNEYPGTNVYKVNGFKDITQGYSTRRDTSSTRMELNALTRCVTYNIRVDAYDKSGKVIAMSEFYPIVVSNSIPCK